MHSRKCSYSDWKKVVPIFRECFSFLSEAERRYDCITYFAGTIVYEDQCRLVGFAMLLEGWPRPEVVWLERIGVASSERRRGLGEQILHDVEQRATQAGYQELGLAVFADNVAASRLYDRMSYERVADAEGKFGYRKRLAPVNHATHVGASDPHHLGLLTKLWRRGLYSLLAAS